MSFLLPDAINLFLYQKLIIPWERQFKHETDCWNKKATEAELKNSGILLVCTPSGEHEALAARLRSVPVTDFVVFTSTTNQMKDLFRQLRNCGLRGEFSTRKNSPPGETVLQFSGGDLNGSTIKIVGQLSFTNLQRLVKALAT